MKIFLFVATAFIVAVVGVSAYILTTRPSNSQNQGPTATACTMEAKLCPDGSYVGRVGPNCDFAECPGAPRGTSSVTGTVAGGIGNPGK